MKTIFAKILVAWLLFSAVAGISSAWALRPGEALADPVLEARARAISKELRCLVCQNESIDDSEADLAHDLRVLVRERLVAGDSDEQVKQYLVARYGTYVLLKPPFDWETVLLWTGPLLLISGGVYLAIGFYRRRIAPLSDAGGLSDTESRRVANLLGDSDLDSGRTG